MLRGDITIIKMTSIRKIYSGSSYIPNSNWSEGVGQFSVTAALTVALAVNLYSCGSFNMILFV